MVEHSDIPPEIERLLSADGDGPAPQIDAAASARMIEHVILQVHAAPVVPRARPYKLGWSAAAAFAIVGSAAAMYAVQRARTSEVEDTRPLPAPAAQGAQAPDVHMPNPAAQAPSAQAPAAERPVPAHALPTRPSATPPRVPARGGNAGDDLLERANRLRGDGDYRAAEHTYSQVVSANPKSAAAYTARVAAAGLRVERLSDPHGALRLYSEALRAGPKGALAPEIHEGMASAYRMLDRRDDERRSLRALLREQPSGAAAERARARLSVVDAHP